MTTTPTKPSERVDQIWSSMNRGVSKIEAVVAYLDERHAAGQVEPECDLAGCPKCVRREPGAKCIAASRAEAAAEAKPRRVRADAPERDWDAEAAGSRGAPVAEPPSPVAGEPFEYLEQLERSLAKFCIERDGALAQLATVEAERGKPMLGPALMRQAVTDVERRIVEAALSAERLGVEADEHPDRGFDWAAKRKLEIQAQNELGKSVRELLALRAKEKADG